MEIKTCEEYVLNELTKKEDEVDKLKQALNNQHIAYARLQTAYEDLSRSMDDLTLRVKKAAEVLDMQIAKLDDDPYVKTKTIWKQYNEDAFDFITNLFDIEDPDDDRPEESATDD